MLNRGATLSQGWTPEDGFRTTRWDSYSELMMLYLLAIGSQTNAIPPSSRIMFVPKIKPRMRKRVSKKRRRP
jgi:hypothetical protein